MLFGEHSGKKKAEEVQDPYYGGTDGFEDAYEQCLRFSKNFLQKAFPNVEAWRERHGPRQRDQESGVQE